MINQDYDYRKNPTSDDERRADEETGRGGETTTRRNNTDDQRHGRQGHGRRTADDVTKTAAVSRKAMERITRGYTPQVRNPYAKDDKATAADAGKADSGKHCPIAPLGIGKNKADGTQGNY